MSVIVRVPLLLPPVLMLNLIAHEFAGVRPVPQVFLSVNGEVALIPLMVRLAVP